MIEFLVLCVAWLVFLVFLSRKGTAHFLRPHVGVTLPVAWGLLSALLEALPTTAWTPGFTLRTVIAIAGGVFAGRIFARLTRLWAEGHVKRAAAGPPARTPRLVHPLIAIGMFLAGVPVLWHVVTANHEFIEEKRTPRDEKTGIAHGCEAVRLDGGADAVLLLHGLYESPAEFGALPAALHEKGLTVHAPLLPGHGHFPGDLDGVWTQDYLKSARAAYDALASDHPRVSVVGCGMGGTLALLVAAERKPEAVVLVNPYLGRLVTPSWSPVSWDAAVGPLSRVVSRVLASDPRIERGYATESLHALRQCRDLGRGLDAAVPNVHARVALIVGDGDAIVPAAHAVEWTKAHLPGADVTELPAGEHSLLLGPEAGDAIGATARSLLRER